MADATFSDVVKAQQETNEILRQQAIADGKPDPKKFIKEEFIAIAAQRGYAKKDRELQTKTAKTVKSSEAKDQEYYKKQLEEQTDTTEEQKVTSSHLSDHVSNLKTLPIYLLSLLKATGVAASERRRVSRAARRAGASKREDENKRKFRETKLFKGIAGLGKGIGKMVSSFGGLLKDKAKAGAKGIFGIFSKLAFGGLALAALAFLNSPKFGKMSKFIRNEIIPKIGSFIENMQTFFSDILESFEKFFADPDFKKSMAAFKKGNLSEGFASMFTSLTKKDGLFDNILTDIVNIFLRALGKTEIGKGMNDTLFSIVDRFSFRMANVLIDAINSVFLSLPEFIRPKLINKLDPITGQEILTEQETELDKRLKKSKMSELEAKKKQIKEDFEAKKINALEAQDADVRVNNEIKALKNKLEREVENKFSLTAGAKTIVDEITKTSQAKGTDINVLFRNKKEEQDRNVKRFERQIGTGKFRTKDGRFISAYEDEFGAGALQMQLSKLKADMRSLELARQRGFDTEGRGLNYHAGTQVVATENNTVNIPTTSLGTGSPVIDKLSAIP
jgi:hypothetical protein